MKPRVSGDEQGEIVGVDLRVGVGEAGKTSVCQDRKAVPVQQRFLGRRERVGPLMLRSRAVASTRDATAVHGMSVLAMAVVRAEERSARRSMVKSGLPHSTPGHATTPAPDPAA